MKAMVALGLVGILWVTQPAFAAANGYSSWLSITNPRTATTFRIAPPPAPRMASPAAAVHLQAATSNCVPRAGTPPPIQPAPGGGRADLGLLKVFFPADVNGSRPVAVTGPDGRQLAFRPRGLAWYDTSSGQRWWLAQITNRLGFIRGAEVIWTNAFDSVRADVRLRYSPRGHRLEQDVILRQRPPLPNGLLAENARLEVWTEWFDSVPTARVAQTVDLRRGSGLTNLSPALVSDESLTFGSSRVGAGFAFSTGAEGERTPVAKAWFRVGGRDWLVETVDFAALKRKLDALASGGSASVTLPASSSEDLIAALAASAADSSRRSAAAAEGQVRDLAQLSTLNSQLSDAPGVVLDFALLSCVPVSPDAVSWWPAGGNANDVIGGQTGSLQNSATYGEGEVGRGFSFPPWDEETETDGDGFVRVPDHEALHFSNALTIEAWIHPHDFDWYHEIVSTWDAVPGQNQKSYTTALSPDGHCYFGLNPTGQDGQDACIISSNAVVVGTWTHIAATYDGSVMRLYLNGELEAEGVYTNGVFAGTNDIGIGACIGGAQDYNPVSPFIGQIDEPALYRRALSASEIKTVYEAGTAGKINPICLSAPADLAAWYPADIHPYDVTGTNFLTLSGGASYAAAVASHGIKFDGDNAAATAPDEAKLNFGAADDLSLELWLQWQETEFSYDYGVQSLAGKRYTEGGVQGWELFLIDGVLGFQMADGNNYANYIASVGDLRDGGWHHVAVSVDRDDEAGGRLYVDGTMILEFDPTSIAGSLANTEPLRVGVHPESGLHCNFSGVLDEAGVYRRALSGTEIAQLYEAGGAGKCKADVDSDGMQDWWEMRHFGTLDRDGTGDYDSDGVSDYAEFGYSDPNTIAALLQFTNLWVATAQPAGTVETRTGVPFKMALLVNSTNFGSAVWQDYNQSFTVSLGSTDGVYEVWVGLRGRAPDSPPYWVGAHLVLDRIAPALVITNPVSAVGSLPLIQIQGLTPEPLQRLWLSLTNGDSVLPYVPGLIKHQDYSVALQTFTTNYFQFFDLKLRGGINTVVLHATDRAGNTTVVTTNLILRADGVAPSLSIVWPPNGMTLGGTSFTLEGWTDDPTATINAAVVDAGGVTNQVTSVVERYGRFWADGLPLAAGANLVLVTAVDAWGNSATAQITVNRSALGLTVNPIAGPLHHARLDVTGTVSDPTWTVWVNGVPATMAGGNWQASGVPVREGGTAVFRVTAYPAGENPTPDPGDPTSNPWSVNAASLSVVQEKPIRLWVSRDMQKCTSTNHSWSWGPGANDIHFDWALGHTWLDGMDSAGSHSAKWSDKDYAWAGSADFLWPASYWHQLTGGRATGHGDWPGEWDIAAPAVGVEYCDVLVESNYHWPNAEREDSWKRDAETEMKLFTGGRPVGDTDHLFLLQSSAAEVLNLLAYPPYTPQSPAPADRRAIPPEQIKWGGCGYLHEDSFLYVVLPDGEEVDATSRVDGKQFYMYGPAASKLANVDLDVDSDNINGLERSWYEDHIEEQTPGKLMPRNDGDSDSDGVPDFADGYDKFGTPDTDGQSAAFTPMVLALPQGTDLDRAKFRFHYVASNPDGVTESGGNYTPAPGGLRVWARDGSQYRKKANLKTYKNTEWGRVRDGDYVEPDIIYDATNLFSGEITGLYVEGIQNGNYEIKVELDPDGRSGFICHDIVVVTVIGVDLDIDSDNNNGIKPPDRSAAEDQIEDDQAKPGKIVYENKGDADFDGIPDFADGCNLDGISENNDDASGTNHFVRVVLELPAEIDWATARLTITYDAADPTNVSQTDGVWSPGAGHLRLWRQDGDQQRKKQSANAASNPGDFIAPGIYSDLSRLGLSANTTTVTQYLEGISVSGAMADQLITVELDPGDGYSVGIGLVDQVRVTVIGVEMVEGTSDTTADPRTVLSDSHAAPYFQDLAVSPLNAPHPNGDGTRLLQTIQVSGRIRSALCDLVPGEDGIIGGLSGGALEDISISLNGEPLTNATIVAFTQFKTNGAPSFTKPFETYTDFNLVFNEVDVSTGVNWFRLAASDKVPGVELTGFAEYSWTVTATPAPPPVLTITGIDPVTLSVLPVQLDFGTNVTSLASLQPTNAVHLQLAIQTNLMAAPGEWQVTPEFVGDLYPVESTLTNSAIFFTNANAWAVVYDRTKLDQFLQGSLTNESVVARVSVPTLGLRDVVVKLKPLASTAGSLVHDYTSTSFQFHTNSAGLIESIDTVMRRLNVGTITNTLTPTAQTNVFASTNGQITATFTGSPEAAIQSGTNMPVALAASSLDLSNTMVVVTPGSSPNAFTTDDGLSAELPAGLAGDGDPGSYFGWAFASTSPQQIAASQAGEVHPYYVRFKGPTSVLDWVRSLYPTKLALGPDNNYYLPNPTNSQTLGSIILGIFSKARPLPALQSPPDMIEEAVGFYYGIGAQAVSDVKGLAEMAVLSARLQQLPPRYLASLVSINLGFGNEQDFKLVTDVGTTAEELSEASKAAWDFWVAANQNAWDIIEAAASGDREAFNKHSETYRMMLIYMAETAVALNNEYATNTPFKRGEIKGRITLEVLLIVLPATKAANAAQISKVAMIERLAEVGWIKNDAKLLNLINRVKALVAGAKPPPVIGGITAEVGSSVVTKTPPPIPQSASVVGESTGALNERWLGAAVMETAQGIKVDEGLGIKLAQVMAIPAEGAEKARVVQNFLISLVSDVFSTATGAQGVTVAEAQKVLSELMKIRHWRQVRVNKNFLMVVGDPLEGEVIAIVGGKAGILQGHHIVEKSMVELLQAWGFTGLDEAQVPLKVLTRSDHIGASGLHQRMWFEWENGVKTSRKSILHPDRLDEFLQNAQDTSHAAQEMMDALIQFYHDNGYDDLEKVTRLWCRANGVPFTK